MRSTKTSLRSGEACSGSDHEAASPFAAEQHRGSGIALTLGSQADLKVTSAFKISRSIKRNSARSKPGSNKIHSRQFGER